MHSDTCIIQRNEHAALTVTRDGLERKGGHAGAMKSVKTHPEIVTRYSRVCVCMSRCNHYQIRKSGGGGGGEIRGGKKTRWRFFPARRRFTRVRKYLRT